MKALMQRLPLHPLVEIHLIAVYAVELTHQLVLIQGLVLPMPEKALLLALLFGLIVIAVALVVEQQLMPVFLD